MNAKDDRATIAAIAVIAAAMVDFDHEALGHGGTCLAVGGRITLLTTSLFACEPSQWIIAAAGPATSLLMGTLALILRRFVPNTRPGLRLWLILLTAFSYFWEGGYLVQAMLTRKGDLYYTALYGLGDLGPTAWLGFAVAGVIFYLFAVRLTGSALSATFGEVVRGQSVARTAWLAATIAATVVALPSPHGWPNWRDTLLSLSVAALPLLLLPRRSGSISVPEIRRSWPVIVLAIVVYTAWMITMGRGLG